MKAIIIAAFSLWSVGGLTQTRLDGTENIAMFSKVWGFLKYHHPAVAKGNIDWDKEFMDRVNIVAHFRSKKEFSSYCLEWIKSLGSIPRCRTCKPPMPDSVTFQIDNSWLSDTNNFTESLSLELKNVFDNRNQDSNYYVQKNKLAENPEFGNEKAYPDSVFPSATMRLLALARYWNIINYYYPYKYRIGADWDSTLLDMIPVFRNCQDTLGYHLALLELITRIHDSHANFPLKYTLEYFGVKWAPFAFRIIDNKAVVTGLLNDTLCAENDIRIGDVFLEVGDKEIKEILKQRSKFIPASNEATVFRGSTFMVFNGSTDSLEVKYERQGNISTKTIGRYLFQEGNLKWPAAKRDTFRVLENNIGYVNLGQLWPEQIEPILSQLENTVAIIFDIRNYPHNTLWGIADFIGSEPKPFAKFTIPDYLTPGAFHFTEPYIIGSLNKHPYRGKIFLLIDETTQSHAEFTVMGLQAAARVICIGSQTAGADGNVAAIIFPGNIPTRITAIGVYYPDGKETQRVGIIPDIEIKPTIAGIRQGKDELLEKAIELARK